MSKRQASYPMQPSLVRQPGRSTYPESVPATSSVLITPSSKLAHKPASDLEKESWNSLAREINLQGVMVVTDHDQPVAVVLSVENYETLVRLAQREQARQAQNIAELNDRVDQRLTSLRGPNAHQALDAFMDEPVVLHGEVRAGSSF